MFWSHHFTFHMSCISLKCTVKVFLQLLHTCIESWEQGHTRFWFEDIFLTFSSMWMYFLMLICYGLTLWGVFFNQDHVRVYMWAIILSERSIHVPWCVHVFMLLFTDLSFLPRHTFHQHFPLNIPFSQTFRITFSDFILTVTELFLNCHFFFSVWRWGCRWVFGNNFLQIGR